jgi:VWFA-related protein
MSNLRRVCLAVLLCLSALAWAQQTPAPAALQSQPASPPAPQDPVLSVRPAPAPRNGEGRVKLDVVVTDKSGRPVSGLELKDFTLLDNKAPVKILSFHPAAATAQAPDPPVEVILLIDAINLPFEQVAVVRQSIVKFLLRNGGHLAQPVSLIQVTDLGVNIQHTPSLDGNALAAQVNQLESGLRTSGRSSEYGGVERHQLSINRLITAVNNETEKPGRKLLIWADSGWPTLDSSYMQLSPGEQRGEFDLIVDLSTWLREARIALYSISTGEPGTDAFFYEPYLKGVKSPAKAGPPNLGLKVLAIQSGGRVLGPDNDLAAQIEDCVRDAGAYYTISFDPARADKPNEYHDLKVQIATPGLKARTNTGYYNQP